MPFTSDMTSLLDLENKRDKNLNDDRILVLEPIDGETVKSSMGLVDPRLFTGGNRLHAIKDPRRALWFMKYDAGSVPPALKQRFTSFGKLYNAAETYFKRRGLRIRETVA